MKSSPFLVADTFSNANYNRFDPAKPFRYYATADELGGGGGVADEGDEGEENETPTQKGKAATGGGVDLAVNAAVIDLVSEHGSENAALKFLVKRNHSLEKVSKNVLPKADRELFNTAKSLGMPAPSLKAMADACTKFNIKPDELGAYIENGSKALQEQTQGKQLTTLEQAAQAKGNKRKVNAKALAALPGILDNAISVEGEGDAEKGFITVKVDGKDVAKPIDEWVETNFPALAKALFDVEDGEEADEDEEELEDDSDDDSEAEQQQQRKPAVAYVKSGGIGSGNAKGKSVFEKIRKKNEERAKSNTRPTTMELAEKAKMKGK